MGHKQLIVVALLLLTPLAYGQIPQVSGIVRGTICCTSTGNCPTGSVGVPGVEVEMNCTGVSGGVETLGQGITNSAGIFSVPINITITLEAPIFTGAPPPCNVVANLPLSPTACPLFNSINGTVTGAPVFRGMGVYSARFEFYVPEFGIVTID
ncbi:hypothetical protein AAHA92_30618 [Salvia divinorum]|uniref:Uncharacterized protein n=1 Tax=Salvia divinorum TaxID=28513 RepID=A0ABD1FTX1_SALDI